MPRNRIGQEYVFATEFDPDYNYTRFVFATARKDDTVRKIMARRGHPDLVRAVCKLNHIRSGTTKLKDGRRIKLPGSAVEKLSFTVLAGDKPATPKSGYAKFENVSVPGSTGLTKFDGYDPFELDVPIRFEALQSGDGQGVEDSIRVLERMAGRGLYGGAAAGPPAVVRVSTTDNWGNVIPLIPLHFQWSSQSQGAPLWRVGDIQWDDSPIRGDDGKRLRQDAIVILFQHTPLNLVGSAATRAKRKAKPLVTVGPWGHVDYPDWANVR